MVRALSDSVHALLGSCGELDAAARCDCGLEEGSVDDLDDHDPHPLPLLVRLYALCSACAAAQHASVCVSLCECCCARHTDRAPRGTSLALTQKYKNERNELPWSKQTVASA